MKSLIIAALLSLSLASFAGTTVEADREGSELSVLSLVLGVKQTYSVTAGLEAKVVELLAGDGMNPTRMVLVLRDGDDVKVFALQNMISEVRRITFLAKDVVVINYSQDSFDQAGNNIVVLDSIKIKIKKNADNTLANTVEVL